MSCGFILPGHTNRTSQSQYKPQGNNSYFHSHIIGPGTLGHELALTPTTGRETCLLSSDSKGGHSPNKHTRKFKLINSLVSREQIIIILCAILNI